MEKIKDKAVIYVSSDSLVIPLKDNSQSSKDFQVLLEGKDKTFLVLSGPVKEIERVINSCCNARESNTGVEIVINNDYFNFK